MAADSLLIFRLGSIGDTVVALPSFRAIARAFPQHHRVLLTSEPTSIRASTVESVLSGTGLIDETLYYPVGGRVLKKFWSLFLELRHRQVRLLIHLQPRPLAATVVRDTLFFRAAGLSQIIGARLRGDLSQCRADPVTGELEFEVERLARTLQPQIPVDVSVDEFDLQLSDSEKLLAATQLQLLGVGDQRGATAPIAVAAGAKWPAKDWGESNWAELIGHLSAAGPRSLILVGAEDERALAERLAMRWPHRSLNLCGQMTPRETAAVLGRCAVLVCHDSGPMHLAASQKTPCVALFGNFNLPHRWFPFGDGHEVIYESSGVRNIPVPRVVEAVERLLQAKNQGVVA
jgi:ADP-heptose:LPS heptosyltransferase